MSQLMPLPRRRPPLDHWQTARPLIAQVRAAVLAADGPCLAAAVLSAAPIQACQRLADFWADAGPLAATLRDSLSHEDRLVLDLVTTTYPPTQTGSVDLSGLVDALLADAT